MKVKDLIEMLKKANPESKVFAYDGDSGEYEEVSGMIYDESDRDIQLQTDGIS